MTTTDPASTPPPAPEPGQEKSRLLHHVVTALLAAGFIGYVLYQHPALRETAAALGGLGTLVLGLVLAARNR